MGVQSVIVIVGAALFFPTVFGKIDRFHSSSSRVLLPVDFKAVGKSLVEVIKSILRS